MIKGYSDWLEEQANLLFQNIAGWENSTLQRIGKRINKYSKLSLADVKAINNIAVVKQDMDAITKELARVTGLNISQIEQMYADLLTEQHFANQPLYDYRGKKFVPFAENRELQAIVRAYAKTTGETMINLAKIKALGFVDKAGNFNNMQSTLVNVLDKAVMSVSTGAEDFNTVVRNAIKELGGSGIRVDYGTAIINGKEVRITRNLATVVRQDVLWGAKQASREYNEMIGKELGTDGEEVDFHFSCRFSHEFMQGKQYCTSGTQTINGEKFIGFSDVDPSSPDGLSAERALQDYGCNHYTTPIICGISEPRYDAKELADLKRKAETPIEIDGVSKKPYEWQQSMRSLENAIRQQKWEKAIATGVSKNDIVKDCNAKIKAFQSKYNEISEITGIAKDPKRMSIPKIEKNSQKNLTKSGNRGIIELTKNDSSKNMSNGMRKSALHTLSDAEINSLKHDIKIIGADENQFVFNSGDATSYSDKHDIVFVKGDILPDTSSTHPRDLMSSRAVLAHEYYGHRTHRGTKLKDGSWNDEFRASYTAAKITPNLSTEDRRYLILDALERAKESGVSIKYNNYIRRMLYE